MPKILVVDDQAMIRKLIKMSLNLPGYDVLEAEDSDQAIQIIQQEIPDLIILDVMMPGDVNGIGLCHIIKNSDDWKHVPIIFLSAKGQRIDIEEGLNTGANDYLLKPFSPEILMNKVSQYLR